MKRVIAAVLLLLGSLTACQSKADTVSTNISKAADQFKINRRIVFYNGITGQYLLVIEGRCSLGNNDSPKELSVTCKTAHGYQKHFLGLSDNVTYFAEQMGDAQVSDTHTKIYFRPGTAIPDVDVQ